MGVFYVEREEYIWCSCKEAYKWTVTFVTASGDVQLLQTDGGDLTGDATISRAISEQQSPWLNGSFSLGLEGFGGDWHYTNPNGLMFNNKDPTRGPIGARFSDMFPQRAIRTRPVSIDASASELSYAIETDLGMKVDEITIANEVSYPIIVMNKPLLISGVYMHVSDVSFDVTLCKKKKKRMIGMAVNILLRLRINIPMRSIIVKMAICRTTQIFMVLITTFCN